MPDLRQFLEGTFAAAGGVLRCEEFMSAALYDPEHGYYTRHIGGVGGRRGDFATSATLSGGLARSVAAWIREEIAHHGWSGAVPVIELGGGDGSLADGILRSLGWRWRRRIHYRLVEISPVLRERQRTLLGRAVAGWHGTLEAALEAVGGRALIVSNEFVDAFPAAWLRWDSSRSAWSEIGVAFEAGTGLREVFLEPPVPWSADDFSALALPDPPDGQRIEILPSCLRWLEAWAGAWREGSMLTIDYGARVAENLYVRRPGGTLRAYHRHERIEGPGIYARFGRQDLTADVNFADLIAWGKRFGISTVRLETQGDFLTRHGAGADTMAKEGAGGAFLVLTQRRPGR